MGIFGNFFSRKRSISDEKQSGKDLIHKLKEHPETEKFIQDGIKEFGDDPVPKIIQQLVSEKFNADAQTICSIWLSYIGEPAIPHLLYCLGDNNYDLATFSAKTLASIEGFLPHMKEALKSDNPNIRLHAAGSLQFSGVEAINAIPDLCELIKNEINMSGETDPRNISEVANIAAGALGKMGESAVPMLGGLLKDDDVNVRLCAVSALSRIGAASINLLREAETEEQDKLILVAIQNTIQTIESR